MVARTFLQVLLGFFCFLVTLVPASAAEPGRWRALIIGIDDYQDPRIPDLKTPVADGRRLAAVLSGTYGFVVTTLFDAQATWAAIDNELRRLAVESGPGDSLLIYYGGHGDLDGEKKEGWWYPVDTVPERRQSFLQNTTLREHIKNIPARHVLLVSDSCFAGTLFGDYRSMAPRIDDRWHQKLYQGKSRLGLTSGGKEPVLDGGSAGHSIFAHHLLNYLEQGARPVFSAGEMFTAIAPIVTNNSPQKPEFLPILYTGHESGEFVFVRQGTELVNYISTAVATSAPVAEGSGGERRLGPLVYTMIGVGAAVMLLGLLLVPRQRNRTRVLACRAAVAARNLSEAERLLAELPKRQPELIEAVAELARPVPGLALSGVRQRLIVAPGPRQGLGRGPDWLFNIADPHISRKPHGWLYAGPDGIRLSADGGEIKVGGEQATLYLLQSGDRIGLGPVTELEVLRVVAGVGAVLVVVEGPERGLKLVLVDGALPLAWLVGDQRQSGRIAWRDGRPWLLVARGEEHPLPVASGQEAIPLVDGDVLRLGEEELAVSLR